LSCDTVVANEQSILQQHNQMYLYGGMPGCL